MLHFIIGGISIVKGAGSLILLDYAFAEGPKSRPLFLKEVRRGPEIAGFRTKTQNISRLVHLIWLEKV